METPVKCVTSIVSTLDGHGSMKHLLDSSPVGLGTVVFFETLATEVSTKFTSIGTTINTNV